MAVGDIVGILDANGTVVVEYKYNAWGIQLSRTGELANTLGLCEPVPLLWVYLRRRDVDVLAAQPVLLP